MSTAKQILFFIVLTFFCAECFAQSERIDSLTKALPALRDSARIDCLNELSEAYHETQTDTARMYVNKALREAEKINYITGMAAAYRNLGRIEAHLSKDFPAMEKYFSRSLKLYVKTEDEHEIAWGWGALGYAKWVLCKFPEAMDAYEKAVEFFEKKRDTGILVILYNQMSNAAIESGRYEKALYYAFKCPELTGEEDYAMLGGLYEMLGDFETALEYSRKWPEDEHNWQFKYLAIGSAFYHKKQYDSALYYYKFFSDWAKKEGNGQLGKFYANSGEVHLAMQQYDTALVYLNTALTMHKTSNDKNQVMRVLLLLAKTYHEKKDYISAMHTMEALLKTANETGARQYSRDAHYLLYRLSEHFKKHNNAYHHLQQYSILKDSIDLDLSAQKLAFYKIKSEREQAQSKINTLNDEKKLQQQKLKQTAQQKNFLISGIIAMLLIAVVLFRNISLKRKNEKLRLEHELELQQLESEKTKVELKQQATDLEMQALRAQMNPHFIFNCLNAINGFILVNESETAADYLTKFSRLIRMVLNNSQKKLISLDEELETLDLYLCMEKLRFTNNFHYNIHCDDTIDALSIFITPMLLQPFAENAVWHGLMHKEGNGELLIDLHCENNVLHCTITDNGIGRKKAASLKSKSAEKNKSLGLQITKDRMALLNGDLNGTSFFEIQDVEDEYGKAIGTRVSLKIRIKETPDENVSENLQNKIANQ